MSEMSKIRNNKIRKNYNESTKTAVLLQTLLPLLFVGIVAGLIVIPAAQAEAKSKFKIEVQICCVSSDSGNAKIKVKLPDGTSTSKNVNLGKLADEQDWDNVSVFFKLKHRYESFKVCVSGLGCQWGEAGDPVQFKGLQ